MNRDRLKAISEVYRPSYIIDTLNISRQVWHNYTSGKHDMPESVVDNICRKFKVKKKELLAVSV